MNKLNTILLLVVITIQVFSAWISYENSYGKLESERLIAEAKKNLQEGFELAEESKLSHQKFLENN